MNKSLWFLKRRFLVLVLSFLLPLIPLTTTYAFGLDYSNESDEKIGNLRKEFMSKCEDRSINIKEVKKAYEKCKKAYAEDYTKIIMPNTIRFLKETKENFLIKDTDGEYKKHNGMPAKWQEKTKTLCENYMKAQSQTFLAFISMVDAKYNLAKVDRTYYKVKNPEEVAKKIEEAKKRLDEEQEKLKIVSRKMFTTFNAYENKIHPRFFQKKMEGLFKSAIKDLVKQKEEIKQIARQTAEETLRHQKEIERIVNQSLDKGKGIS
jgi:hypothetical protein